MCCALSGVRERESNTVLLLVCIISFLKPASVLIVKWRLRKVTKGPPFEMLIYLLLPAESDRQITNSWARWQDQVSATILLLLQGLNTKTLLILQRGKIAIVRRIRRRSDQNQTTTTKGGGGAFHLTRGRHLHHTAAANLNTALPLQLMAAVTGLRVEGGMTTGVGVVH